MFILTLPSGIRRGEVFAVTWENVDLDRRTIRVCQSITYQRKVKTPKTQAGIRTLAIDATTGSHLAMWKARQATELARIGVKQTEKTPGVLLGHGRLVPHRQLRALVGSLAQGTLLEGLKFHELRHTQATQLLANGVDVKTVRPAWDTPTPASRWAGTPTQSPRRTTRPQTCSAICSQATRPPAKTPPKRLQRAWRRRMKMSPLCLQKEQSEAQKSRPAA